MKLAKRAENELALNRELTELEEKLATLDSRHTLLSHEIDRARNSLPAFERKEKLVPEFKRLTHRIRILVKKKRLTHDQERSLRVLTRKKDSLRTQLDELYAEIQLHLEALPAFQTARMLDKEINGLTKAQARLLKKIGQLTAHNQNAESDHQFL